MIPRAVVTLGIVAVINAVFVLAFFKELKLSSFDPVLATSRRTAAGSLARHANRRAASELAASNFATGGNTAPDHPGSGSSAPLMLAMPLGCSAPSSVSVPLTTTRIAPPPAPLHSPPFDIPPEPSAVGSSTLP